MDVIEFLTARLDEEEQRAKQVEDYGGCCAGCACGCSDVPRMLREVEAKRKIVAEHYIAQGTHEGRSHRVCTRCSDYVERGEVFRPEPAPCKTLRLVALPYSDRPDYRDEWKP